MDNSTDSMETEEEGIQFYVDLSRLWKTAGMRARKWISNSTKVLEQIPCEDRADKAEILEKLLPEVKTICVQWLPQNDQLTFTVSNNEEKGSIAKRMVLRRIATLFDPLGFLAPYIKQEKMMIQELWLHELE